MLTVCCVLRSGGIYNSSHVSRLREQVALYLTQPYRFVCLSDMDVLCERIALTDNLPGWWGKIELWRPGRFQGRVLYLDLDVTIIGGLDELADYPAPFAICRDWIPIRGHGLSKFNSSVMSWNAGSTDHIYTNFTPDVMNRLNGDQDFIAEQMPWAEIFLADWCVSYKVQKHIKLKTLPAETRVIVYHGLPKSWDLPSDHLEEFRLV